MKKTAKKVAAKKMVAGSPAARLMDKLPMAKADMLKQKKAKKY